MLRETHRSQGILRSVLNREAIARLNRLKQAASLLLVSAIVPYQQNKLGDQVDQFHIH